ncbi:Ribosomal protein L35 [Forsythia ovata]|uniref:Ribosomal protein L35 n=1 Tax=Forsythia ovata TaxID=205694 RepID=A0ABD1WEP5_9LAMI
MQRWCSRFRSMAALHYTARLHTHNSFSIPNRPLCTSPNSIRPLFTHSVISPDFKPLFNAPSILHISHSSLLPPPHFMQVRQITAKQRTRKLKSRKPMTPVTSKLKKYKIKCYSSFKGRFRIMKDGQIRRWKEGKRHNAHLKSKKSKRRLRQPGIVPAAYAKVMKKLNFCG